MGLKQTIQDGSQHYAIDKYPQICPYCHNNIIPKFISNNVAASHIELVFLCPSDNCKRYFIALYKRTNMIFRNQLFRTDYNGTNIGVPKGFPQIL